MRILIVEDEKKIASFIQRGLKEQHFTVDISNDGEEGFYKAQENIYDLVVLDVMLPSKDGLSVCRDLRKKGIDTPILMLTAKSETSDKVAGLDSGADDYLTKPFAFDEFLARVRVLTRRKKTNKTPYLKIADLELDQITHKVKRAGTAIDLTSTEYKLLEFLMINVNQIVTRTMIAEHVWNDDFDRFSNVINVYISYLHNKVDKGFSKKLIHSVRGTGYILKE
jgi:DNA-binding response OmpR family regulator